MPSLTRAEAAALGRRAQQPVKAPGELFAIWVSIPPVNPMNGSLSGAHWSKKRAWSNRRRDHVALLVFEAAGFKHAIDPDTPKRVRFIVYSGNAYDDDNLRMVCKPHRDGLIDAAIIHDDRRGAGHVFDYENVVSRGRNAKRGVEIRVSLLDSAGGGA